MKNDLQKLLIHKYSFTFLLFVLVAAGCSSTYRLSKFASKEKFYNDFNDFAKDKTVKVKLMSGNVFEITDGEVCNDTLFVVNKVKETKPLRIAMKDIDKINYTGTDYRSAVISLKNGDVIKAENIKIITGSMIFDGTKILNTRKLVVPVDKVREISYKIRWPGLITGFLGGTIVGVCIGYLGFPNIKSSSGSMGDTVEENRPGEIFIGGVAGMAAGSILGWLIGYNYTYEFNP